MELIISALIVSVTVLLAAAFGKRMQDRINHRFPIHRGIEMNGGVHETQVRTWVGHQVEVLYGNKNAPFLSNSILLKWGELGIYIRSEVDGGLIFVSFHAVISIKLLEE